MARQRSKMGTEKTLNSQCTQFTREHEPKVDGMDGRVPAAGYRNTSTAARVKKERIVLERTVVQDRRQERRKRTRERWQR